MSEKTADQTVDPVTQMFNEGRLVHVFAGKDSGTVVPLPGENILKTIARAQKLSRDGDVWLTPHWC